MGIVEQLDARPWLTTQQVAPMLQMTDATFLRNLPALQRDEGFPLAAGFRKRPKLFHAGAVNAWLATQAQRSAGGLDGQEEEELQGLDGAAVHLRKLAGGEV